MTDTGQSRSRGAAGLPSAPLNRPQKLFLLGLFLLPLVALAGFVFQRAMGLWLLGALSLGLGLLVYGWRRSDAIRSRRPLAILLWVYRVLFVLLLAALLLLLAFASRLGPVR